MNDNVKKALLDGKTTIQTEVDVLDKNLFDKNDMKIINGYPDTLTNTILASTQSKSFYLKVKPNTTYFLKKKISNRFNAVTLTSEPSVGSSFSNYKASNESSEMLYKTNANAVYMLVRYFYNDTNEQDIIDSISVREQVTLNEKNGVVSWDYEDFRHVKDEGFIGQFVARKVNGTIKNISDDFNMTDKEFILKMGVNVYPDYKRIYLSEDSDGKYRLTGNSTQETRSNKNLFDYYNNFKPSYQGLTNTINEDGSITVNGKPTKDYTRITPRIDITNKLEDGQKYSLWQENNDKHVFVEIRLINKETNGVVGYVQRNSSFTANPNTYKYDIALLTTTVASWGSEEKTVTGFYQLEKGDKTFFEKPGPMPSPDFPSEIINTLNQGTYQTYLGNDNYIFDVPSDLAGIGDVKNELVIDKENSTFEFTERVRKLILNGDENIMLDTISSKGISQFSLYINGIQLETDHFRINTLSDYFKGVVWENSWTIDNTITAKYNDSKIRIYTSKFSTVEDFKTWLSSNPVTVYYQLATPNVITGTLTKKEYDTTWYNLGNFLVTKVTDDEVNDKTTFEALDYTKRFNQRYNDTITYPCTAIDLARNVCEQCGCELGSTSFKNSDFEIKGNVFTNGETCRDVMKQIGKLAFSWVRVDLDNKVYIDFTSNKTVDEYNKIDNSKYYTLKTQKEKIGAINRVVIGYKDIEGERTKLEDADDITVNGVHEITVFDNPLVYNQELREKVIEQAQDLIGLEYMPMEILTVGHPWLKGDELLEVTDMEGKVHKTIPLDRTIQYFGHIKTKINVGTNTKTNTELAYDSGVGGRLRRTEIIVNKIDGTISEILEYQDETTKKLNQTISSVDETKQTISKVETKVEDITTTTITSSGGNSLHLTEAMESNALDYKIDGNSYQEVRSGKNLFDIDNFQIADQEKISNYEKLETGYKIITGADASSTFYGRIVIDTRNFLTDTFILSCDVTFSASCKIAIGWSSNGNENLTQVIPANEKTRVTLTGQVGNYLTLGCFGPNVTASFENIMISEEGGEYEQYGATPSPDYPSEVEVVKGYNLLELSEDNHETTTNSSTNNNGAITFNKDSLLVDTSNMPSANGRGDWFYVPLEIGKDYTLSWGSNGNFTNIRLYKLDKTTSIETSSNATGNMTINATENGCYFRVWTSGETIARLDYAMINEGTTPKPYVPYKNIAVKTTGKNLSQLENGSLWDSTGNERDLTNSVRTNFIEFNKDITLTPSIISNLETRYLQYVLYDKNKNFISLNYFTNKLPIIITNESVKYIRFKVMGPANGTMTTDDIKFQVEKGTTVTDYEPYQENITYIDLQDNEICKAGDIKDTLKIKDNQVVLTKRIGKMVLDGSGSEIWYQANGNIDTVYVANISHYGVNKLSNTDGFLSDKFRYLGNAQLSNLGNAMSFGENDYANYCYIQLKNSGITSGDEFKVWLSENPITVYYQLAEPYEVALKLTNIPLFEGINNISLLSTLDTNTYIKYLRKTPLSDDYATNQQLNQTNENLANTDNKTSLNATEINNTNNKLNNDYYNKTQVDSMNTTTENRITQIENTVETTKTSTDYQISIIQKQLENGVTKLDTNTGFVFDKDGLKISKSDSEMNSQLDHDGLIVKRKDTTVLSVRSTGVETENLKVKTYFTIGKNTRVEDYKDGTGFFYIGGAE